MNIIIYYKVVVSVILTTSVTQQDYIYVNICVVCRSLNIEALAIIYIRCLLQGYTVT